MKRSIIFDLDGTLWDTTKEIEYVWKEVAKKYKLNINQIQIKKIMGLTANDIISYLFSDNLEKGRQFLEECQNEENKYLSNFGGHIYNNTIETIKELYKKYNLYIVSNCQTGYIEAFLNFYNLGKYFEDYECSGNTGEEKDNNIKYIIKRNNISECIYIGDTEKDFLASKNNNIKFIWASYGFGLCKDYDDTINDISELIEKI